MQAELRTGYAFLANCVDFEVFIANNAIIIASIGDAWQLANSDNMYMNDKGHCISVTGY